MVSGDTKARGFSDLRMFGISFRERILQKANLFTCKCYIFSCERAIAEIEVDVFRGFRRAHRDLSQFSAKLLLMNHEVKVTFPMNYFFD